MGRVMSMSGMKKSNHRAACGVMSDYSRYGSVSNLKHDLNWQPLQICCRISRLQVFYKAVHNLMALSLPQHICDWAYENQPCERIKIAYFFQLCSVITHIPFV